MGKDMRVVLAVRIASLLIACSLFLPLAAAAADRQIVSGPYSLSVRGGSENNSAAIGFDGRVDYLTRMVNLHLLGTFEMLEPNRGLGAIDQQRYGAALALSHTFPAKANVYAGTAFVNQMGENFGHAYLGGKIKVAEFALLTAAYGFGFGGIQQISKASSLLAAESVDWLEAGVVLASSQGLKLNAYYTLTDPGDLNVSGVAGEISYPIFGDLTLGVKGNADLNPDTGYWRNWGLFGFLTVAMGNQKGSPIDVALEKNNPLKLPVVLNKNIQQAISGGTLQVTISGNTSVPSGNNSILTAVHDGTAPFTYTWTLTNISGNNFAQGEWPENIKTYQVVLLPFASLTDLATLRVIVQDSEGRTGTATVTLTANLSPS